jgi:hypothetical protein
LTIHIGQIDFLVADWTGLLPGLRPFLKTDVVEDVLVRAVDLVNFFTFDDRIEADGAHKLPLIRF